jgi:hypothetical protein
MLQLFFHVLPRSRAPSQLLAAAPEFNRQDGQAARASYSQMFITAISNFSGPLEIQWESKFAASPCHTRVMSSISSQNAGKLGVSGFMAATKSIGC